jgi:hypothetical protein
MSVAMSFPDHCDEISRLVAFRRTRADAISATLTGQGHGIAQISFKQVHRILPKMTQRRFNAARFNSRVP